MAGWTLNYLRKMDPYAFEALIARLWKAMGWHRVTVTQNSRDNGIDIEAERGWLRRRRALIQAKLYSEENLVGVNVVRELASLRLRRPDARELALVTTADFTRGAVEENERYYKMTLINGEELLELLNRYVKPPKALRRRWWPFWRSAQEGSISGSPCG